MNFAKFSRTPPVDAPTAAKIAKYSCSASPYFYFFIFRKIQIYVKISKTYSATWNRSKKLSSWTIFDLKELNLFQEILQLILTTSMKHVCLNFCPMGFPHLKYIYKMCDKISQHLLWKIDNISNLWTFLHIFINRITHWDVL